jgi:hypothetical protein
MTVTDQSSARLVRLPLWTGMPPEAPRQVSAALAAAVSMRV